MSEPTSEELVFPEKTVRCGCVLHGGMDHSHIEGCPSLRVLDLQKSNAELSMRLMAIRDSLDWLFSGELDKNIE